MTNLIRQKQPILIAPVLTDSDNCRLQRDSVVWALLVLLAFLAIPTDVSAKGEPAEAFVKQLRNAGYYDTAISYLDRTKTTAGVDPSFVAAIPLEKAQTHIESALRSRNSDGRDQALGDAQKALEGFLTAGSHPRQNEARLQLGKLQMIRAAQFLSGEPDDQKRAKARESYLAASKTFDDVVANLLPILKEIRGQKIDAQADPAAAAQREQYQFEFMQSKLNAADAIKLAAMTTADPAKNGKAQLEDAFKRLTEFNKKYAAYIPGAIALVHLGDINETLGRSDEALDNYLKMLEQPEVDELRDAKFHAATGLIRLKIAADPPRYQDAIDRASSWVKEIRPDEAALPVIQDFRIELAKAYLLKAADKDLKKGVSSRAKSDGRDLLFAAKKVSGPHVEQVDAMLADLGVEKPDATLPTAEPPKSFEDALEKATQILSVTADLDGALTVIQQQKQTPELAKQVADIEQQRKESYAMGVQILRGGLVMVTDETNLESINQARQILAYFLYQTQRHRETVVVGNFLARNAAGTDVGLKGGLMALSSMQILLGEIPEDENAGLLLQLESLGSFLAKTWPDDPNASAAQGLQIRLLLKKDDFDGAQSLIDQMGEGSERSSFKRLLGQMFWNQSVVARIEEKDEEKSKSILERAKSNLQPGLDEIQGNVDLDGMKAALILAKIYHLQGDNDATLKVLDHPKYGPLSLVETLGTPSESFLGDLYGTQLKALVGKMLADENPDKHLDQMIKTMEKLRGAFKGPDSQKRLTQIYVPLAGELKTQLDSASPARKTKLIKAFRVMLKRISDSTQDDTTLRWVAQTLTSMGESLIPKGQAKATGQAADLLNQAIETFQSLSSQDDVTTAFLLGRAQRLVGKFGESINTFDKLLKKNPQMLEAQVEAATAYESWAATLPPKNAWKAYKVALEGARPGANKKNTIWGWIELSNKTSKMISRNEAFKEKFFDYRYHVALCLYQMGKVSNRKTDTQKAIKVIREAATLFPTLGGPERRAQYDLLMKEAQRAVGEKPVGIGKPTEPKRAAS